MCRVTGVSRLCALFVDRWAKDSWKKSRQAAWRGYKKDMNTLTTPFARRSIEDFPAFDLSRLLKTVFDPKPGQKVAILIDLADPSAMRDFGFLKDPALTIQRKAYEVFYEGLRNGVAEELGLTGGEMFAYALTGGSNLDLPDEAVDATGATISLERDVYPNYDLILCVSTFSATAPLTAFAKQYGFRGATLHGLNDVILATGLAVNYREVSAEAEKLRLALTKADSFEIDFQVDGETYQLTLETNGQEAQKSHGLCLGDTPDIANLPAGEVYFVPEGAEGRFPMRFEHDGTIAVMDVTGGRIVKATLLSGDQSIVDAYNERLASDPVTGEIGELGFGTQDLPVSGRDIQDEKVLGTLHVATGRSDHLGGHLTPELFASRLNASHDDILFSPAKTPEISVPQARMIRDGKSTPIIENFEPTAYLLAAIEA
jgi:aminopeptidase